METKKIHFLAGLPRSGTTLLSSILNQNPDIYATPNSPLCQIMWDTQQDILKTEQFQVFQDLPYLDRIVGGIAKSAYSDRNEKHILDKCRDWGNPYNLEMIQRHITTEPKFVLVVRDILDILASFITLLNKPNQNTTYYDAELSFYYRGINDARCDFLMKPNGIIDRALWSIKNVMDNSNYILITYDELIENPETTTLAVCDFLEVDSFEYNFSNIINKYPEDDKMFGLNGFHDIRKTISKISKPYQDVLSEYVINKYKNHEVWNGN